MGWRSYPAFPEYTCNAIGRQIYPASCSVCTSPPAYYRPKFVVSKCRP